MAKLTQVAVLLIISVCLALGQGCTLPYEPIGSQCLFIDPLQDGSYFNMRLYCSTQNGKLAKIPDANQMAEIIYHIHDMGLDHSHYWVGATDEDYEGIFTWEDGTSVPKGAPFWRYDCSSRYPLRPSIDPNSNCAFMDSEYNFYLSDTSCLGDHGEIKYSPICEQV